MPSPSERHEREQYFFDAATREALADALAGVGHVCCLCTPTLAEALAARGQPVTLLDLDERFAHVPGFRRYDLTRPEWLGIAFDALVCDPPFFTVSLTRLRLAIEELSHFDARVPVLISYLTRRDRALLTAFDGLGLRPTGFLPTYETVADTEKNAIQFYGSPSIAVRLPERGSPAWMERVATKTSKFLSLVLRHDPARIGIELDAGGWADAEALLDAANRHGVALNRALLEYVVATNRKQRFTFSADGTRLRANQGHSVEVELGLAPVAPPDVLYHGTARRNLRAILRDGLVRRQRHHVHLSLDAATARQVGQRHGTPVVLTIAAAQMHAEGHAFFRSANGVWLTDAVPPVYVSVRERDG